MKKITALLIAVTCALCVITGFVACSFAPADLSDGSMGDVEKPNPGRPGGEVVPNEPVLKDIIGIEFPAISVTYNGMSHVAAIVGELPDGVKVEYFNNVGVDATIYTAEAKIFGEGYNTLTLVTTINIKKGDFDGVVFENETFAHNGERHCIQVKGDIPDDTEIQYKVVGSAQSAAGDLPYSVTDKGTYRVMAILQNKNYNTKVLNAVLTIA